MDENKKNPEIEETVEELREEQTPETVAEEPAAEPAEEPEAEPTEESSEEEEEEDEDEDEDEPEKEKKPKRVRNQAFLRRGSFSIAITAAVLAGIVVLNVLAGVLAKRFPLEIDMTAEKKHSVSAENVEYLKKVDKEVTVTVCADEKNYVSYMSYYYGGSMTADISEYLEQTATLLEKYPLYNKKIKVQYIDPQSSEFDKITQQYPSEQFGYGSIIVSAMRDGKETYKVLSFIDIYAVEEDSSYAAYGISSYTMTGNNLETALTGAIAYVVGGKSKKVAILTGHSKEDVTATYQELLKSSSYEVVVVEDPLLKTISDEYDAVVIAAPTADFMEAEVNALSDFLNNGGKRNKSLLYFASASAPYLPNLSSFLAEWGIALEEGTLFETNDEYHMEEDPTTIIMPLNEEHTDLGGGANFCLLASNVPLLKGSDALSGVETEVLVQTYDSVVKAPVGVSANWKGAGDQKKKSYAAVLRSEMKDYDDDNQEIKSQVFAFSSTDILNSQFNSYNVVANENVVVACSELAIGTVESDIHFNAKTITTDSFVQPTENKVKTVRRVFMLLIPLLLIAAGVAVYIRRRNAR